MSKYCTEVKFRAKIFTQITIWAHPYGCYINEASWRMGKCHRASFTAWQSRCRNVIMFLLKSTEKPTLVKIRSTLIYWASGVVFGFMHAFKIVSNNKLSKSQGETTQEIIRTELKVATEVIKKLKRRLVFERMRLQNILFIFWIDNLVSVKSGHRCTSRNCLQRTILLSKTEKTLSYRPVTHHTGSYFRLQWAA